MFSTSNRYAIFIITTTDSENMENEQSGSPEFNSIAHKSSSSPLLPPVFIKSVNNFVLFCTKIKGIISTEDQFVCKSSINDIKLTTNTPNAYRLIIKFLHESNAKYHTNQPKKDRVFRVVIRNLRHSTEIQNIKKEIEDFGFRYSNINNVPTLKQKGNY